MQWSVACEPGYSDFSERNYPVVHLAEVDLAERPKPDRHGDLARNWARSEIPRLGRFMNISGNS